MLACPVLRPRRFLSSDHLMFGCCLPLYPRRRHLDVTHFGAQSHGLPARCPTLHLQVPHPMQDSLSSCWSGLSGRVNRFLLQRLHAYFCACSSAEPAGHLKRFQYLHISSFNQAYPDARTPAFPAPACLLASNVLKEFATVSSAKVRYLILLKNQD